MKSSFDSDLNECHDVFDQDHDHLRDSLMASLGASSAQPKRSRIIRLAQFMGGTIMNRRITKCAAAAMIIIVALIIIQKFGGSIDGTSVAWGEVAKKVQQIHTLTHREKRICTVVGEEKPLKETDVFKYCSSEYGVVEEQYNDSGQLMHQFYLLIGEKNGIMIFPPVKKYICIPLDEQTMQRLNQINPKGMVEWFCSEEHTKLGRKTINGVKAEGFEVKNPRMLTDLAQHLQYLCPLEESVMRLWVDVKTSLPIRAEAEAVTGKGFLTGFKRMEINAVAYDIQWGVALDEEVFEPNIPDDYTFLTLQPDENE
ncbi:MAG: hypothetical protein ACYTBJ_11495 [Planctomycetota bacterium]|jgi:hypothetical protein